MAFILFVGGIVIGFGGGWLVWGSHLPDLKREVRRQISIREDAAVSGEPDRQAVSRAEDRVAELQAELVAASMQLVQARDEHWELRRSLALAEGKLGPRAAASGEQQVDSPESVAQVVALREELAAARLALADEQVRQQATEAELAAVRAERDTEAGQVAGLRAELAAAVAEPDDIRAQNDVVRPMATESRRKRIAQVLREAQSDAAVGDASVDDLTAINGIGPFLRQKLRELGITTFRQIADLSAADVERVDAELNFKGRIGRERWIEQARNILQSG